MFERIVFHHIPKTGGTCVLEALKSYGVTQARIPWVGLRNGRAFLDGYRLPASGNVPMVVSSHHAFHPERFDDMIDELYVTWVRNPIDMVYSSYAYFHGAVQGHIARPTHLFSRILKHPTLESYIDAVLADAMPFFPMTFFTGLELDAFDFVGSSNRMGHSIARLFEKFPIVRLLLGSHFV